VNRENQPRAFKLERDYPFLWTVCLLAWNCRSAGGARSIDKGPALPEVGLPLP